LAQVLLARAYPDSQAFPLRQRDGGRDALGFDWENDERSLRLFQVKFVENPSSIDDPHKWIIETMKGEAPKVARLIPKGASSYHLITNVRGTGHADSGSIDKLDSVLSESVGLPSTCWWRDDLVVRLADAPHLRWEFPELLSGIDVIREVIESELGDAQRRRVGALRAFLAQQHNDDRKIRFKQVDLQNDLLGLFIDVPASISLSGRTTKERFKDASMWNEFHRRLTRDSGSESIPRIVGHWLDPTQTPSGPNRVTLPTSDLLLDGDFQSKIPRVVIEGAPGQGKSTLTQYLCQVHRMRLLGKDLSLLPQAHVGSPLRLPFRLDLRDVAEWIDGNNPFSPGDDLALSWPRTLEGFLAANVYYFSGGVSFEVADLLAVLDKSATVIVCDGLDEVPDIAKRERIVEELTAAAGRLDVNAISLQMVITSRPADFAKSPGFDATQFRYMSLEALPAQAAEDYSEKWIKAKSLGGRDAAEVRRVLAAKLGRSHMRELARNAMQLTILLSLIYARGSSLPDKRTALYDAYIETFLDRESEKSAVVREHRDLLLALHGHLAWTLHYEAEDGRSTGQMPRGRLLEEITSYLDRLGHGTAIVQDLFDGVVERVFVLVSRVEGTYEFEVQPLREYFAARHLYNTAPYSPTGAEAGGTITERFAALARNPYWLNVARFYAGCFSEGEIGALVYGLRDLVEEKEFKVLGHPRVLAGMLLADWVFTQAPRSVEPAVEIMSDALGVQLVAGERRWRAAQASSPLPERSGQTELADLLISRLDKGPKLEYAVSLTQVLRRQAPNAGLKERWTKRVTGESGKSRARWLDYGAKMGVLQDATEAELDAVLGETVGKDDVIALMRAGHGEYCERDPRRASTAVDAVLDGELVMSRAPEDEPATTLEKFAGAYVFSAYEIQSRSGDPRRPAAQAGDNGSGIVRKCERVLAVVHEVHTRPAGEWFTSLSPWEVFIEASREEFGERWAHTALAVQAAGIRSPGATYTEAAELFDSTVPLARRARYARLRAGNPKWWGQQLAAATGSANRLLAVSIMFAWASGRTLVSHIEQLDELLATAKASDYERARRAVQRAGATWQQMQRDTPRRLSVRSLPGELSERTVLMIASREPVATQRALYDRYLREYRGRNPAALDLCVASEMTRGGLDTRTWRRVLRFLRRHPGRPAVAFTPYSLLRYGRAQPSMPLSVAREICEAAHLYPQDLVWQAEERCRLAVDFVPVATKARHGGWFSSP
jgi:hypothetical protein